MKRKDFGTDEEGCGTVGFVQIELQRGKTLLLDVKFQASLVLTAAESNINTIAKKTPNRRRRRFSIYQLRAVLVPNRACNIYAYIHSYIVV